MTDGTSIRTTIRQWLDGDDTINPLDIGLSPNFGTLFADATRDLPIIKSYKFGSGAVLASGQTGIGNATDLVKYFNPGLDSTGTNRVNNELQAYSQSFSFGNHVIQSDNLQITGTLDSGGVVAPMASGYLGDNSAFDPTNFTLSQINISSNAGWAVGRVLIFTYFGIYAITGVSGSGGSTTITTTGLFGSPGSIPGSLFTPYAVLPYYYATTNATSAAGSTVLHFASVPTGVTAGMFVALYNGNIYSSQTYKVTGVGATTVTIDVALSGSDAVGNPQGIFFLPPIRSGQIWTKDSFSIPGNGGKYLTMDALVKLPPNSRVYNDAAGFTNAAANGPYGAWPFIFLYGANGTGIADGSEVDILEAYASIVRALSSLDINIVKIPAGGGTDAATALSYDTEYLYKASDWDYVNPVYTYARGGVDFGADYNHFQFIWTPNDLSVYINDRLMKRTRYKWTSGRNPQLGLGLAIGSLSNGLGTNNLWPHSTANFPSMTMNIKSIELKGA